MTNPAMDDSRWRRPILAVILLAAAVLGAQGITSESSVLLGGDMARYLMNGVFVRDFLAQGGAWSYDAAVRFAELYYARYPALSLGHHPPLPFVALAPFFAVLGVSVKTARIANLLWFLVATGAMYSLVRRLSGWQAASWATALFVTNVYVLRFGQYVLSEMPMVALVLIAMNALLVYCETRRLRHFLFFVGAFVLSLFAKQLAVFMVPVYVAVIIVKLGWRTLVKRWWIVASAVILLVVLPLAAMAIFAPANVNLVIQQILRLLAGTRRLSVAQIVERIFQAHLSWPVGVMAIIGFVMLTIRRDSRALIGFLWVAAVVGGTVVVAGGQEPARYSFGALPAYFLLAAGLSGQLKMPAARIALTAALCLTLGWQVWEVRHVRPTGGAGYEEAAEYVVAQSRQPTVLFDAEVDSGFFVFFTRKHADVKPMIVMRLDKLMIKPQPGSPRGAWGEWSPDAFYAALRQFGVHYLVVEERPARSIGYQKMNEELKIGPFVERRRIPIGSSTEGLGMHLVIYEFLQAQAPDPDAIVDINLPLGGREIKVRMRDLLTNADYR